MQSKNPKRVKYPRYGGIFCEGLFFVFGLFVALISTTNTASLVNFFTEFVNQIRAVKSFGLGEVNKGEMGGFEELFEVLGSDVKRAQGSLFGRLVSWIGEFDGANRTKGAFVTEDEINGFILDETFGSLAILGTNFVVEKRGNFNLRNDVKFFTKKFD